MALTDDLLQGSFRGFPFYLKEGKTKAKNFTTKHDYLNTDANDVENNGPDSKEFSISVWVKGDSPENYRLARDKFIEVLDERGSGELVHPYLGVMDMVVTAYTFSDTLGITEFDIELIEVKPAFKVKVDFQSESEKTLRAFNASVSQESSLNISAIFKSGYQFEKSEVFSVLEGISTVKNFLDDSEYTAKINSLLDLAKDEQQWSNIYDFFSNYLNLDYHTKPFINLYHRLLSFKREYILESDLVIDKITKQGENLVKETLKMVAISKLGEKAIDGYLSNDEIDLIINKIKTSIQDPIIPGIHYELEKISNLFFSLKSEGKRVIEVLESTPALVVAWMEGVGMEAFKSYDINALEGTFRV